MPPSQGLPPQLKNNSISPRSSAAPLLQPSQQETGDADGGETEAAREIDPKTGKKRFFGLGGKKHEKDSKNMDLAVGGMLPSTQSAVTAMKPDLHAPPAPIPISPRHPYSPAVAASPSRLRSSSPRLHSPASSEIFERNVQEPVALSALQSESTPAHMPTHVITEDHIPAALEASAQAITSEELDPDDVEIVTSSAHQPAVEKVLEGSTSFADLTSLQSPSLKHTTSDASDLLPSVGGAHTGAEDEGASTYGQLDPNDVRRLSFISFADVVQSEHQQQAAGSSLGDVGNRDSLHIANFVPGNFSNAQERAGSPLRSPRSPSSLSGGVTTPPLPGVNVHPSEEQSPARSQTGLASSGTIQHGELNIETMRQAVRKTASGDLSHVRSAGMSPISDENSTREARSRTNT
jgi:hypothetical protein